MTIHDDLFTIGSQAVLEHQHGRAITLSDGVSELTPTAIVTAETLQRRHEETGTQIVYTRQATIAATTVDNLTGGRPSVGMTAVLDGNEYTVEDVMSDGNAMTISLARYQVRERSRPTYRGRY